MRVRKKGGTRCRRAVLASALARWFNAGVQVSLSSVSARCFLDARLPLSCWPNQNIANPGILPARVPVSRADLLATGRGVTFLGRALALLHASDASVVPRLRSSVVR